MATGLEIPWDLDFLPDGRALVTERPGRVRLLDADGTLRPQPVARVAVSAKGEGGLLGLAVDPAFASNRFVYLYSTTAKGMRLERRRWTGSELTPDASLVAGIAAGSVHDSGRIGFGPDGRLYVATGDAGRPALAQDPASPNGKLLALTPEQYRGHALVRPAVVALGLRNPQGFDWDPATGALVANDHGPSGFDGPEGYDEVNRIVQGRNYGWPKAIGVATRGGAYAAPLQVYRQAIAPSGGAFVRRPGSLWTGSYLLAALRGQSLRRLVLSGGRVVVDEPVLRGYGRLRTVKEGPDGRLYVLTSNRDGRGHPVAGDDRILAVTPPPAAARGFQASIDASADTGAFVPDDSGSGRVPGGWAALQWNFTGPFGVGAPAAWAHVAAAGRPGAAGVTVAVLDTGVAYANRYPYRRSPDLSAARFVPGWDFVGNDRYPIDIHGHGTHVASTIAEETNNRRALTGLAYGARIMPVRVLDRYGHGGPAEIAAGIRFAADHGAKVINMSLSFPTTVRADQIPELVEAVGYATSRGSLIVASTGNAGEPEIGYPARLDPVLAVGATTEHGCAASVSNSGPGIDIAAPGGGVDARLPGDPACKPGRSGRSIYQVTYKPPGIWTFAIRGFVGTSMSAAHVSAAAALVVASGVLGPDPTPAAIAERLTQTARDLGAASYDLHYGWGLLDAAAATAPPHEVPITQAGDRTEAGGTHAYGRL